VNDDINEQASYIDWILYALFVVLILFTSSYVFAKDKAGALDETRCCIAPVKAADGSNLRRADVLKAFQKIHPCPVTGLITGACKGWEKDHIIPLQCGGRDEVANLQWLPVQIKSAAGLYPKDRWERKVYCNPQELVK